MNIESKQISCFHNHYSNRAVSIPLLGFMESMKTEFKNEVKRLRAEPNKEVRNKIKLSLPCVMPSGLFASKKADSLQKHSGIIVIDIDGKDNPNISDWNELKTKCAALPEILFSAVSVSGNGLFMFVPIVSTHKHKEHFAALEKAFLKLGIVIDNAGANVNRLRCITYDPTAHINLNATPYRNVYEPKEARQPQHTTTRTNVQLSKLNDWIVKTYGVFSSGNRHNFILGSAMCYKRFEFSEPDTLAELIQYASSTYPQKEIYRVVRSVYRKH